MKYSNFILTVVAIGLFLLSASIYFKPVSQRYIFSKSNYIDENNDVYEELQDTATGKKYGWFWHWHLDSSSNDWTPSSSTTTVTDLAHNKMTVYKPPSPSGGFIVDDQKRYQAEQEELIRRKLKRN